ncbi:unnamed protein product [Microthlaspi erraticum]|uniref:Uncharacterized protein n=1 Tax=Microthlaspi erraticum TaxID=1685480 RepID=A0A6D2IYZ3_9BRAS|nr:unnamed protein product [Microthlaspi erraticum]
MNTKQKEAVSTDAQAKRRSSKMPKEARSYCPQHLEYANSLSQDHFQQPPRCRQAQSQATTRSSCVTTSSNCNVFEKLTRDHPQTSQDDSQNSKLATLAKELRTCRRRLTGGGGGALHRHPTKILDESEQPSKPKPDHAPTRNQSTHTKKKPPRSNSKQTEKHTQLNC